MAHLQTENIAITGISATVPANKLSNADYPFSTDQERNLFIKTTGIEERRIINRPLTAADLCLKAAEKLMEEMHLDRSEIKILLFVTQTPDYITPASAVKMQHDLRLNTECLAFDINLGCSGYVYGLSSAASLLSNMKEGKALLLVGDTSSACISEKDKSAAPLFSDAGSATLLEKKKGSSLDFILESDGSGYQSIIIPDGGYRNPFQESSLEMKEETKGINRNATHLILRGIDIFNFSVKSVPQQLRDLLQLKNKTVSDIDFFVLHQANKIINDTIAKKTGFESNQAPLSLKRFGNTSSASIPVTMVSEIREDLENKSLKMILSGFGVGLSWASVYVASDGIKCLPLIEIE